MISKYGADIVPNAQGEAFAGEFPTVDGDAYTEPGWVALSSLFTGDELGERTRDASWAAMAGAFVRSMRKQAGLTQAELACKSGIKQPIISKIERGVGSLGLSFGTLMRLVEACGMEIGFSSKHQQSSAIDIISNVAEMVAAGVLQQPPLSLEEVGITQKMLRSVEEADAVRAKVRKTLRVRVYGSAAARRTRASRVEKAIGSKVERAIDVRVESLKRILRKRELLEVIP